ncbi:MAG TPA: nucleoside-triphosphatase [Desulfuromonadales bacterium]|nr:nucleoside-triphosphatase [Desulfuromonadales bacterium]
MTLNPCHLFITGQPGCGKTTLIRRLAESLIDLRPGVREAILPAVRQGLTRRFGDR